MVERARLTTDAVRQILLKRAAKAGLKGTLAEPFSLHGLRAGFVTTAYGNGVPDEEIMGHTRHRSLTTMRSTKPMPNGPETDPDPTRQLTVSRPARASLLASGVVVVPGIVADAGEHATPPVSGVLCRHHP